MAVRVASGQRTFIDVADGSYLQVWCRSADTPASPTGSTFSAPGTPWSTTQPAANGNPLWSCGGRFDSAGNRLGAWQSPIRSEGSTGPQGVRAKRYLGMFQAVAGAEATADLAAEASAAAEGLGVVAGDFYLFTTSLTSGLGAAKIRALGGTWADVPNPTSEQRTLALGDIVDRATFLDGGAVLAVKDVSIVRTLLAKLILAQDVSVFGKLIAASGFVGPFRFTTAGGRADPWGAADTRFSVFAEIKSMLTAAGLGFTDVSILGWITYEKWISTGTGSTATFVESGEKQLTRVSLSDVPGTLVEAWFRDSDGTNAYWLAGPSDPAPSGTVADGPLGSLQFKPGSGAGLYLYKITSIDLSAILRPTVLVEDISPDRTDMVSLGTSAKRYKEVWGTHRGVANLDTLTLGAMYGMTYLDTASIDVIISKLVSRGTLTYQAIAAPSRVRVLDGGTVSGNVTLPALEVGETLIICYYGTASGYLITPSSGYYNIDVSMDVIGSEAILNSYTKSSTNGTDGKFSRGRKVPPSRSSSPTYMIGAGYVTTVTYTRSS